MGIQYLKPVILCGGCFTFSGFELGEDKTLDFVAKH
jgi:hypothetical protein